MAYTLPNYSLQIDTGIARFLNVLFCVADDAIDHILHRAKEHQAVFSSERHPWPHVADEYLVIEGVPAVQFKHLTSKVDKLLTWGASFTVFAQTYNRPAIRVAGYLLCATILKTDMSPPPKQWAAMQGYV